MIHFEIHAGDMPVVKGDIGGRTAQDMESTVMIQIPETDRDHASIYAEIGDELIVLATAIRAMAGIPPHPSHNISLVRLNTHEPA